MLSEQVLLKSIMQDPIKGMNGWINSYMDEWIDSQMDIRINKWTDRQVNRLKNKLIDSFNRVYNQIK